MKQTLCCVVLLIVLASTKLPAQGVVEGRLLEEQTNLQYNYPLKIWNHWIPIASRLQTEEFPDDYFISFTPLPLNTAKHAERIIMLDANTGTPAYVRSIKATGLPDELTFDFFYHDHLQQHYMTERGMVVVRDTNFRIVKVADITDPHHVEPLNDGSYLVMAVADSMYDLPDSSYIYYDSTTNDYYTFDPLEVKLLDQNLNKIAGFHVWDSLLNMATGEIEIVVPSDHTHIFEHNRFGLFVGPYVDDKHPNSWTVYETRDGRVLITLNMFYGFEQIILEYQPVTNRFVILGRKLPPGDARGNFVYVTNALDDLDGDHDSDIVFDTIIPARGPEPILWMKSYANNTVVDETKMFTSEVNSFAYMVELDFNTMTIDTLWISPRDYATHGEALGGVRFDLAEGVNHSSTEVLNCRKMIAYGAGSLGINSNLEAPNFGILNGNNEWVFAASSTLYSPNEEFGMIYRMDGGVMPHLQHMRPQVDTLYKGNAVWTLSVDSAASQLAYCVWSTGDTSWSIDITVDQDEISDYFCWGPKADATIGMGLLTYLGGWSPQGEFVSVPMRIIGRDAKVVAVNDRNEAMPAIKVFPNPTDNMTRVMLPYNEVKYYNLVITDMLGKEVHKQESITQPILEIDMSHRAPGTYLMHIKGFNNGLVNNRTIQLVVTSKRAS